MFKDQLQRDGHIMLLFCVTGQQGPARHIQSVCTYFFPYMIHPFGSSISSLIILICVELYHNILPY